METIAGATTLTYECVVHNDLLRSMFGDSPKSMGIIDLKNICGCNMCAARSTVNLVTTFDALALAWLQQPPESQAISLRTATRLYTHKISITIHLVGREGKPLCCYKTLRISIQASFWAPIRTPDAAPHEPKGHPRAAHSVTITATEKLRGESTDKSGFADAAPTSEEKQEGDGSI